MTTTRPMAVAQVAISDERDSGSGTRTIFVLLDPEELDRPGEVVEAVELYAREVRCWVMFSGSGRLRLVEPGDLAEGGRWADPSGAAPSLRLVSTEDGPRLPEGGLESDDPDAGRELTSEELDALRGGTEDGDGDEGGPVSGGRG